MSPVYVDGTVLSSFDLALIEDTGWYKVDWSVGRNLTVTRNAGCDFIWV